MCDVILRVCVHPGIYTLAKQITEGYLTCRKVNKQALKGKPLGGRNRGLRPFQIVQADYIGLAWVGSLRYLLVTVDHLIGSRLHLYLC
jgi:hypothetical protein